MVSTFTTNVSLEQPADGDYVDDWNVPVNADWGAIDAVLGNTTTINAVAASGTVTLTLTQYRPRIWTISGTLTANVNYQIPSGVGGTWSIANSTSGAYSITISSAGGGSTVVIAQGDRTIVCCDGTNVFFATTSGVVPIGLIAIWSGSTGSIPNDWHLCDGTNGTIDLRDKFIVGAGNTYAVGATGGAVNNTPTITVASHTLTLTEIPGHTHGINDPTHTHTVSDPTHNHGVNDPTHLHAPSSGGQFMTLTSGTFGSNTGGSNVGQNPGGTNTAAASTGITLNAASTGITNQNAATGISTQSAGGGAGHTHTASSSAVPTIPPYYALAFIQKIA